MVIYFNAFYEPPRLSDHMLTSDILSAFAAQDMALFPPLNVSENKDSITIRALIPGATLEDVDLSIYRQTISIKGELVPVKGRYSLQERPVGRFQRLVDLGFTPTPNQICAGMKNGVLTIVLPKPTGEKIRRIPILQKGEQP